MTDAVVNFNLCQIQEGDSIEVVPSGMNEGQPIELDALRIMKL